MAVHIYVLKQAQSGSVPADQQIGGLQKAAACSCSRPGGYGELAATPVAAIRHYANQTARPLWPLRRGPNFTLRYRGVNAHLA